MPDVIRKDNWTEDKLQAAGFARYERKKQVVLARRLPENEAPKQIRTSYGDILVASVGYMICYAAGTQVQPTLDDYDHWPVEPAIFEQTYRPWDEPEWQPTPPEQHLMSLGCQPFYKAAGVWAKPLEEDIYIQSLEHEQPVKIDSGQILAIGAEGEPYSMGSQTFHDRYQMPKPPPPSSPIRQAVKKLLRFFRG